jgi:acyl-ACP thioesterase
MDPQALTELVPPPDGGRVFSQSRRPWLGDCAPSGRIRLDALARWLQDVAYADVEDAGVADRAVWVVRRTRLSVARFPRFGESFTVLTFCSGIGRMWAERRTTISRDGRSTADVEAVALWVHLDPVRREPTPLTPAELSAYSGGTGSRRIRARLRHPGPDSARRQRSWTFRATECDLADHVNNAAYWEPLEEDLLTRPDPQRVDVEIEFRTPAQPGEKLVLHDDNRLWIVGQGGETHASVIVAAIG